MPTPDDNILKEPPELQVKGLMVTQEFLRRDYESVLNLLRIQEQELALLWLLIFATMGVALYRGRRIDKLLKEIYDA